MAAYCLLPHLGWELLTTARRHSRQAKGPLQTGQVCVTLQRVGLQGDVTRLRMKARSMECRKSQKGTRNGQEGVRALGTGGHPDLAKPFINVWPEHFRMRNHSTRNSPESTIACLHGARTSNIPCCVCALVRLCWLFSAVDQSSLATSTSSGTQISVVPSFAPSYRSAFSLGLVHAQFEQ